MSSDQQLSRKGLRKTEEQAADLKDDVVLPTSRFSKLPADGASKASGPRRSWLVALWAFSVMGFFVVITVTFSRHGREGARGKANKDKV